MSAPLDLDAIRTHHAAAARWFERYEDGQRVELGREAHADRAALLDALDANDYVLQIAREEAKTNLEAKNYWEERADAAQAAVERATLKNEQYGQMLLDCGVDPDDATGLPDALLVLKAANTTLIGQLAEAQAALDEMRAAKWRRRSLSAWRRRIERAALLAEVDEMRGPEEGAVTCEICGRPAEVTCSGLDVPALEFCREHGVQHARTCPDVKARRAWMSEPVR